MTDLNPQATQMADASMVRTLAAQAQAIWPQEVGLIRRYELAGDIHMETSSWWIRCEATAAVARFSPPEVVAYFNRMIANIRDPRGYAVWLVPVVSARA